MYSSLTTKFRGSNTYDATKTNTRIHVVSSISQCLSTSTPRSETSWSMNNWRSGLHLLQPSPTHKTITTRIPIQFYWIRLVYNMNGSYKMFLVIMIWVDLTQRSRFSLVCHYLNFKCLIHLHCNFSSNPVMLTLALWRLLLGVLLVMH